MRTQNFNPFIVTTALTVVLATTGCSQGAGQKESLSAPEEFRMSQLDVNLYPVTKTVCDPWQNDPDPRSNFGLIAQLFTISSNDPEQTSVKTRIEKGRMVDQNLFFSQLNVPTRKFELGFINDAGEAIRGKDNNVLDEYFALRFKSVVKLAADQEPGLYEFAILSDDGSLLRVREDDGVWRTNVNNDGDHPTRLGCAANPYQFDRDTERMIEVDYYQGPRYHISMILLMRKVTGSLSKDPSCGLTGNDTWFDYNKNSKPKKAYTDLLARGWRPLTKENFSLPNQAVFNPCKEGVIPNISNFRVAEAMSNGFLVAWETDIPATSQVVVTDVKTGEKTVTTSDNALRTSHSVIVRDLKAATEYALQAVSISDTYGKGMTAAIRATTEP